MYAAWLQELAERLDERPLAPLASVVMSRDVRFLRQLAGQLRELEAEYVDPGTGKRRPPPDHEALVRITNLLVDPLP